MVGIRHFFVIDNYSIICYNIVNGTERMLKNMDKRIEEKVDKIMEEHCKKQKEYVHEKEIREYINFVYSGIISINAIDKMIDNGDIWFIPNISVLEFIKKIIDVDLYHANFIFINFLDKLYQKDAKAVNELMYYIDKDLPQWYHLANCRDDIITKINEVVLKCFFGCSLVEKEDTVNIFNGYFLHYGFTKSNIDCIYKGFIDYFKRVNTCATFFETCNGVLVVKKFEI